MYNKNKKDSIVYKEGENAYEKWFYPFGLEPSFLNYLFCLPAFEQLILPASCNHILILASFYSFDLICFAPATSESLAKTSVLACSASICLLTITV